MLLAALRKVVTYVTKSGISLFDDFFYCKPEYVCNGCVEYD